MYDFDRDSYDVMAAESLTRPDPYTNPASFWGEGMYTTHGPLFAWADRSDDLIGESNYHAIVSDLERDEIDEEDWFQASISHWAVGNLETIWVRWYDDNGEPTNAGILAFELKEALRDYPILDESDYSDREFKAMEENFEQSFSMEMGRLYDRDFNDADIEVIRERVWQNEMDNGECGSDAAWISGDDLQEVVNEFLDEVQNNARQEIRNTEDSMYFELIGA